MITPQNVFRHELIGLPVEVIDSNHNDFIGIKGKIIDETRNTITVDTGLDEKQLPKENVTILLTLPGDKKVSIEGKVIIARPEDRIKKKFKKIR
ncbi:ribonuclease P protein component 1 [Methanosphaera sp. WGK6]|uniref:ribonuclease P protein component 1 n=1 Tax=Methanosphaera sp. WGK6 TaxID=1561964 RepID=UPI00084BC9FB|nr:ribonuclease P protein component 1 [Methanosphaera sp. WGK6]OED29789.1 ribonuclease P [Methanosphaera sp. WGK6]